MKYDDIKWHLNDEFPQDLDSKRALTHMGIFMGWVIDMKLEGEILKENFYKELQKFRERKITGADFLELCSDCKLVSEDLNAEANEFAKDYYDSGQYFDDYVEYSDDNFLTIFHEPNTWEKYESIKRVITERYEEWKNN
ncbi:hypothetical protein CAPN006_10300 [Capnocytophaga canimorsus]|uniref:DUF7832 domain-containing protein n=1 Tax=Capnocytophaga canimorsus TaxID=28188 RepID=UPI001AC34939|nr:hypothetical protein [Capnocytophaga canimorsus]GIM56636.1 hypothetical protein CAPN006_10300 [Capnocytophaga canimorsus]